MVKRLVLLAFLVVSGVFLSERMMAQRILGGMSLGMNLTQVDGDEFFGYHKFGLNIGPMVAVPFGKGRNWSVSMELLYSQKGSYHSGSADTTRYRLTLDYVEIPLIVHYTDKNLISGGVGFCYGRVVNFKETQNHYYDNLFKYQTGLSNNEYSVIADMQIRIWSKLWADLRYQYTMKSYRTVVVDNPWVYPRNPYTRYQYNNVISIRVTWVFNQQKGTYVPPRHTDSE